MKEALLAAALVVSPAALADNYEFLPGDAYFSSALSAKNINGATQNGELTLSFSEGHCEMAECAYIGFGELTITEVPEQTLELLRKALREAETKLVPTLTPLEMLWSDLRAWRRAKPLHAEMCPPGNQRVLVYPRDFDPRTTRLFEGFNEGWRYEAERWDTHINEDERTESPPTKDCCPDLEVVPPLGPQPTGLGEPLTMRWADVQLIITTVDTRNKLSEHHVLERKSADTEWTTKVLDEEPDYGLLDGSGFYRLAEDLERLHFTDGAWTPRPLEADPPKRVAVGCHSAAAPMGLWILVSTLLLRRRKS